MAVSQHRMHDLSRITQVGCWIRQRCASMVTRRERRVFEGYYAASDGDNAPHGAVDRIPAILVIGPPASGKSTFCPIFCCLLKAQLVTFLEVADTYARADFCHSALVRECLRRQRHVPDHAVFAAVSHYFSRCGASSLVLDSFPKTVAQMTFLDRYIEVRAVLAMRTCFRTSVVRAFGRGLARDRFGRLIRQHFKRWYQLLKLIRHCQTRGIDVLTIDWRGKTPVGIATEAAAWASRSRQRCI